MNRRRILQTLTATTRTRLLPHLRKAHSWTGSLLERLDSVLKIEGPAPERGPRWTHLSEPLAVLPERRYRYVPRSDADGAEVSVVARLMTSAHQGRINVAFGDIYREAMERVDAFEGAPTPSLAPVGTDIHECYFDFEMPTEFEDLLARMEGRPGTVDVHFDDEGPNVSSPDFAIEGRRQ